jgi:ubiquinol-cytochrome c reductase cytochrome c subunit
MAAALLALGLAGCEEAAPAQDESGLVGEGGDAAVRGVADASAPVPGLDAATPVPDAGGGGAGGAGGGGAGGAGGGGAGGANDGGAIDGGALFRQRCAPCHGPDGSGGPVNPNSIRGSTNIAPTVRAGRGVMPAFPDLTDEEIAAIEAFLSDDAGGAGGAGGGAPPQPLDWRQTFATVCASCHGMAGEGTESAPPIQRPVPGFARYVIRNGRAPTGYPAAMPSFSADALSDADLDSLVDWLGSFPKPADGEGLYRMFCGNCHGPGGSGGRVRERITDELDEVREQVRDGEGGTRYADRTEYMPSWSRDELTDGEVDRIVEYLGGQPGGGGDDDHDDEDHDDEADED